MLTVQDRKEGDAAIVKVSGKITFDAMQPLNERLQEIYSHRELKCLVLNLEGVQHVDSSGIGILVAARNIMNRNMGQLYLCGLRPSVRTILNKMSLLNYFAICETEEEALRGARLLDPCEASQTQHA